MAQYRVLYDFSAVEEGEISVRSGQVVVLKGASWAPLLRAPLRSAGARNASPAPLSLPLLTSFPPHPHPSLTPLPTRTDGTAPQDGWAEVYVATAPDRSGFVPFDYLAVLGAGGAGALPEHALPSATPRTAADTVAPPAPAPPAAAAASAAPYSSYASSAAATAPSALNAAEEFAQLFSSHEAWFKSAAAKRQEVYAALKAEAADVLRALRESEAKSASVLARIAELDGMVAAERTRFQGAR
jgi:hypothetical protein